jgi:hypothetical protein
MKFRSTFDTELLEQHSHRTLSRQQLPTFAREIDSHRTMHVDKTDLRLKIFSSFMTFTLQIPNPMGLDIKTPRPVSSGVVKGQAATFDEPFSFPSLFRCQCWQAAD